MRSTEETTIKSFCDDFIELIEEPIKVDDYQFKVTTSIGIARYPYDGNQISDLIKHADIAMYHAKSLGGSQKHMHFSKQMIEKIKRRNKIELLLKNAKFDQEFELYYQPQVDTITGQLTGMEALLRWHHPDEGFISPGEFIPISEEIGLISDISQWVFKTAMSQMKLWYDRYDQELMMGLNLSPLIINNIRFFERLRALVDLTGVNPNHIEFEITEHSAMSTATIMEEVFSSLSDIGFHISIDDFGTGYSSLSYLKRFSIDRIKIARELIENLPADSDDLHIVKAIVMMAEGMGLKTIGEGVETKDQLDILRTIGCDCIQGYYFGTPMPAEAFERKYFNETFEL
jgi:EAL domain-containing protein (putative c-di-GMP-specific phosphodiesterase class I)